MASLPPPTRPSTPDSIADTIERSRDEDERVRSRAALILGFNESAPARTRLLEMVEDESRNVRYFVARALSGKTGEDIEAAVKKLMEDPDPEVQTMARNAL